MVLVQTTDFSSIDRMRDIGDDKEATLLVKAEELFPRYSWPGNVRELRRVVITKAGSTISRRKLS